MFDSSKQKSISWRTCLKPWVFWWLCNQFLSFCLGQVWYPTASIPLLTLQGSCTGSTMAVDHPNQLLTRPLLCLVPKATQQMDFYWICAGPLSTVSMSGQTAVPGPPRWPLLGTFWCVCITHSHPKVSAQTTPWVDAFPWTSVLPKDKMITMTFNHSWPEPNSNQLSLSACPISRL